MPAGASMVKCPHCATVNSVAAAPQPQQPTLIQNLFQPQNWFAPQQPQYTVGAAPVRRQPTAPVPQYPSATYPTQYPGAGPAAPGSQCC